ncbi:MAG: hypothetical protein IT562_10715 [Alphaproteobacteria bacterium]|nr:hypothetical protein [Alphaproteobacteria bacterium]
MDTHQQPGTPEPPAPRPVRYLARVDAHCACLPAGARKAFLEDQRAAWERKYAAWLAGKVLADIPVDASMWDFRDTIDGLTRRLGKFSTEAA